MGKGDIKTKKGKITKGTFGVRRPKKANKNAAPVAKKAKPKKATAKKPATKKAEAKKTTEKKPAAKKKEE